MQNFEQYESHKQALLKVYQIVVESDLLPIDATGVQQVNERRQDLEVGRFVVAVCGRIKAGKSTLLNALLFRDWVMPTDDMPHTAKNTVVEYGLEEELEVTFYDREEWNALMAQMHASAVHIGDEFFLEIAQAAQKGIHAKDWIKAQARLERFDCLDDLFKFVTPVEKGGIYTPFVKAVKILYPHSWLRQVTIVDTPGVDDPYKFREDQTKQFVTRADAVLFVTYAGQAMSQPDFDFLNDYMLHVLPERRLIVVNKTDTLKRGSTDVDAYLDDLMKSPEPAIRNVFGKRDSVHMVSALGGLIFEAEQAGRALPDDYVYYRKQMAASGFLDPVKNGIDALRLKVEERLVTHQGASILDAHIKFLESLFERKRRQVNAELTLKLARLDDLSLTQDQLLVHATEIESEIATMEETLNFQKKALEVENHGYFVTLKGAFRKAASETISRTKQEVNLETDINVMGHGAAWIFFTCFDVEKKKLEDAHQVCIRKIEDRFKKFAEEMRASWSRWRSSASLDASLSVSVYETMDSLHSLAGNIGTTEQLNKLRQESTYFYQRWFNTSGGRKETAAAIGEFLHKQLNAAMDSKYKDVEKELKGELQQKISQIGEQLSSVQQGRLRDKQKLLKGHHDRKVERATLQREIAAIHERLNTLEQLEKNVNANITRRLN